MVGLRKRIVFVFIQTDPAEINRTAQIDSSGYILAAKDIHDNLKMCIGVFNRCQMPVDVHIQINFLFNFPDAGHPGRLAVSDLAARKFP